MSRQTDNEDQHAYQQEVVARRLAESMPIAGGYRVWTALVFDEQAETKYEEAKGGWVMRLVCQIPGEVCPRVIQSIDVSASMYHIQELVRLAPGGELA